MTCAQPVMPGLIARRPRWRSVYWADLHGQRRARADQRHVAAQHVQQVRAARPASSGAAARPTRVTRESFASIARPAPMCSAPSTIVRSLSTSNRPPVHADAPLPVDDRPGRLQPDRDHRRRQHGRGERQRERGDDDVECTADHASMHPAVSGALGSLPRCLRPVAQPIPQPGGGRGGGEHVVAGDQQRAHAQRPAEQRADAAARAAARA